MSRGLISAAAVFVSIVFFVACGDDAKVGTLTQALTGECVVTGNLGSKFVQAVNDNGDTLKRYYPQAGLAVVVTADCAAYDGFGNAAPDMTIQWLPGNETKVAVGSFTPASLPADDDDFFFGLQWGHDAVNAPEAWAKGVRGAGVKVAVLDTGFDLDHPDLAPNIDLANSVDFTGEGLEYALPDTFSHGTHTAGTIAAADNGFGTIGVAPDATLILVKVLRDSGIGDFEWVMAGMVHAADVGAKVISMSLGGYVPQKYATMMNHVVNYCRNKGAVIVAAAGNDALDLDHIQKFTIPDYFGPGLDLVFNNGSWEHIPSGLYNVLAISATAPVGWAKDPDGTFLDNLASYSNYGQSTVDLGAPGGDYIYPGNEYCTVAGLSRPCWVFDLVFSTGNNGWYWGAGTSMATPHAAGIAALIISEGGNTNPAQVEAKMLLRAADLGKPGNDDAYGNGRVESGY
jgi:subtilisin family serine protease